MNKLILGLALLTLGGIWFYKNEQFNQIQLEKFKQAKGQFKWTYTSKNEEEYRFKVFQSNLSLIEKHNSSNLSYTLEINHFADRTWEELQSQYLTPLENISYTQCEDDTEQYQEDIRTIDWDAQGKVTSVKNQGNCGSCWAFASTAAIESGWAIKSGQLSDLSEQQLIDCSRDYQNHGCGGGLIDRAFHYAMDFKMMLLKDYPYTGKNTKDCKYDEGKEGVLMKKCIRQIPGQDGMTQALKKRPVAVALAADLTLFFYKFGVYNPWLCGTQVNHAVLAVGFDLDHSPAYYRVKNSWGKWWGQWGYFKIAISKETTNGTCNIAGSGKNFYPLMDQ